MKIDRHGKAAILTPEDIQLLFSEGLQTTRNRALFACMLFTGCRIQEACTLRTKDVYDQSGIVRPKLIIRKGNTKGKLATRTIPVIEDYLVTIELLFGNYQSMADAAKLVAKATKKPVKVDVVETSIKLVFARNTTRTWFCSV
jgi:integrase